MDFGTIIYVVIIIIVVVANIYKGIKKAAEEQRQRQQENANRPPTNYPPPQQQTQTIPDPWQEPKPTPAPQRRTDTSRPQPSRTQPAPRKKTIEEILEEMTRQYEQPQTPKAERLDSPYSKIDMPSSPIDKPNAPLSKNYKFDESTATRSLSAQSYTNILEEHDTLDAQGSVHSQPFNPREAFKYAILLERKYR